MIEARLLTAIRVNPSFAPPYDRLGVLLAMQDRGLEEAHQSVLKAVELDPGNVNFRLDAARILLRVNRPDDAIALLEPASKMARTADQTAAIEQALKSARQQQAQHKSR